jgi:uncharacterized damage-inducible protein DinB
MNKLLTAVFLALLSVTGAVAQATKAPANVGEVIDHQFSNFEHEFVPAAEAMPADKYDFAPTQGDFKGVRTFAQQVKHVSAVQYMLAAALLGEKPPIDVKGENGPDDIKTKDQIVKFAKDSSVYLHKAIISVNDKNALEMIDTPFGGKASRLALANMSIGHGFDHYGQMAVYLRMNSVIPPASRQ